MSLQIERFPLRTQRLTLTPSSPDDTGAFWKAIQISLPELEPWMAWTSGVSVETVGEHLATLPPAWAQGLDFSFTICEDGDVTGMCSLKIPDAHSTQGELGYWLRSDRAGKGFMTEAARAVRDFAFDVAGRHRLNLRAGLGNVGSRRVAEKIGFSPEGVMRDGGSGAKAHYDCYLYGMLAADPRP